MKIQVIELNPRTPRAVHIALLKLMNFVTHQTP